MLCRISPKSAGHAPVGHWWWVCLPPVARGMLSRGLLGQIVGRGLLVSQERGQKLGFEQQSSSPSVPCCSARTKFKLSNRVCVRGCVNLSFSIKVELNFDFSFFPSPP